MSKAQSRRGKVFPGADEQTPSRSQYFSWINNTNEGATEAQTQANLAFFQWLRDEYGMVLDIYAFDAGAIDGAGGCGTMDSERFARQFPRGFAPLVELAKAMDCRLGIWGGPDGFGETAADARSRREMMVSLCRDHHFALFKMDAVCGQLRKEKRGEFVKMMTDCRKYSPDLILLNHRLDLGEGLAHATTFLFEGAETYIDVHMANSVTATHNRVVALARGLVPGLKRLTEDHGVCLSSCLDYWEDDLVLQAFNRCLILAPEIYGNPWLLRDDELPRLARLYNLHRRYRDIMVSGMVLPETQFGPLAVSRGNRTTRLITLRNLTWQSVRHLIPLDETIGLGVKSGPIHVRRYHPHERILGDFEPGSSVTVEVLPFRACLLLVTADEVAEPGVIGCDYDVIRDVPGKDLVIRLLGMPGTTHKIGLVQPAEDVRIDGSPCPELSSGKPLRVEFAGKTLSARWHRKLGRLVPCPVPPDARSLYEATCFAADSNALEVRELERSGPTKHLPVQAARDAFFAQPLFRRRDLWDRNLFDDDPQTGFAVGRRWGEMRVRGGCFRLDLGEPTHIDRLVLEVGSEHDLQPLKSQESTWGAVSADLKTWTSQQFWADTDIHAQLPAGRPIRYIVLGTTPDRIREVRGFYHGKALNRRNWRASNLLASYGSAPAILAWQLDFRLDEAPKGSYVAIALNGVHGCELAYAALRVGDGYAGANRRAPSFPSNSWECPVRAVDRNYTYYIPVTPAMVGKPLQAVVTLHHVQNWWTPLPKVPPKVNVRPDAWITAYPIPFESKELVIKRS